MLPGILLAAPHPHPHDTRPHGDLCFPPPPGPRAGAHLRVQAGQCTHLQALVEVCRGAPRLLPAAHTQQQQVHQIRLHPARFPLPVQVGNCFMTWTTCFREWQLFCAVYGCSIGPIRPVSIRSGGLLCPPPPTLLRAASPAPTSFGFHHFTDTTELIWGEMLGARNVWDVDIFLSLKLCMFDTRYCRYVNLGPQMF